MRASTGGQRMLTAAHCGVAGASWQNDNSSSSFGTLSTSVTKCMVQNASGCKDLALRATPA